MLKAGSFKPLLLIVFLFLKFGDVYAQPLESYFQQKVNYTIKVTLDDTEHSLRGDIEIEYINNSPKELHQIYFHLWPNAYKNNQTALSKQLLKNGNATLYYANEEERGYIGELNFKIDGEPVIWQLDSIHIDICNLILNKPLTSGNKINISTPFYVKIPSGRFSRLGHIGQSYQITQWYPKPAVFDQNGWHPMPYLNQGEFYSEFGSFDVRITLPSNYIVGATGDMDDDDPEYYRLNQLAEKTSQIDQYPSDMTFPVSEIQTKTLRYRQDNVHDFAWFADKRYNVLKGFVLLPKSGKKVTTWSMFTNDKAELWKNSIEYVNDGILYYSKWIGEYPYKHATAVDGTISAGGGMEYPNVTVIGSTSSAIALETVIVHEIGHNWFYGILGNNEREHPWMDEGVNSFYEQRYMYTKYPASRFPSQSVLGNMKGKMAHNLGLDQINSKKLNELGYLLNARRNYDQAGNLNAEQYTTTNYGTTVYMKTALAFDYLKGYLGEVVFDSAMQYYFDQWKFKHPRPENLWQTLGSISGKDLTWFKEDLQNSAKKIDFKIRSVKKNPLSDTILVKISNKGQAMGPVSVGTMSRGEIQKLIWTEPFHGTAIISIPNNNPTHIKIDPLLEIPEVKRTNNLYRTKGIFRKTEPLQLKQLFYVENPERTQLFFLPVTGWNQYDKWLPGLALYNSIIPEKDLNFAIIPMYSTGLNTMTGTGMVGFNKSTYSGPFRQISPSFHFNRFSFNNNPLHSNYTKMVPQVIFNFKEYNLTAKTEHSLRARYLNIKLNNPVFNRTLNKYELEQGIHHFVDLQYKISGNRKLDPYSIIINNELGEKYVKSSLEFDYAISYKKKRKGIEFRIFGGGFPDNRNVTYQRFQLSGLSARSITNRDYLFDHIIHGRSETNGVLAQQFVEKEGGFKVYTPIAQSNKWLGSFNFKAQLPFKLPVGIFADAGTFHGANKSLNNKPILADAGIMVRLIPDIFEVYFPLYKSSVIKDYFEANGLNYWSEVRFQLRFEDLNPFKLIKSIDY